MSQGAIKLAVLVSGGGTTLQNLVDQIGAEKLHADIAVVIAGRQGIKGIERANNAGIACHIVERNKFTSEAEFSEKIFETCDSAGAELVCLAGWLSRLKIPQTWQGRVMNIHPALLPNFGGAGMYGTRVHQAVLDHGCKISGCTVHFVDDEYDSGPIILQRCCAVLEGDTAETLARRVFDEEKIAYVEAIEMYRLKQLTLEGRRVKIGAHPQRKHDRG